jgi:formamidopyrimidine-DNA glycosylase
VALPSRRLTEQPDHPVVAALLDQRCVAGFGNLWVNELCFLRGHNGSRDRRGFGPGRRHRARVRRRFSMAVTIARTPVRVSTINRLFCSSWSFISLRM